MVVNSVVFNKLVSKVKDSVLEKALNNIVHNYDAMLIFLAAYSEEFLDRILVQEQFSLDQEIQKEADILQQTNEYDISITKEELDEFIGTESSELYYETNMLILQYMNAFGISQLIIEKNIDQPKRYMIGLIEIYFNLVADNLGPVERNSTVLYITRDIIRRRKMIEKFKDMIS